MGVVETEIETSNRCRFFIAHVCRTPPSGTGSGSFTSTCSRSSSAAADVITHEITGTLRRSHFVRPVEPIEGPATSINVTADSYSVPFEGTPRPALHDQPSGELATRFEQDRCYGQGDIVTTKSLPKPVN